MPKPKKSGKKTKVAPVFKIFCEGDKTERYYVQKYIDRYHSAHRGVLLVPKARTNTPVSLVQEAIDARENEQDVIWAVYDREAVNKYDHKLHKEACLLAKKHDINIAFSNVCFEYWLLLHFRYTSASFSNCDDLLRRSPLKELLKERGVDKYDKGVPIIFDVVSREDGIAKAMRNGERCKKQAIDSAEPGKESPCYLNPYVDVQELFLAMQCFVDTKKGN